jgi:hypothetical protein
VAFRLAPSLLNVLEPSLGCTVKRYQQMKNILCNKDICESIFPTSALNDDAGKDQTSYDLRIRE